MLEMVHNRVAAGETTVVSTAAVLRCGKQMEKRPHYNFSWRVSLQNICELLRLEISSTLEISVWKRLWTCRETDKYLIRDYWVLGLCPSTGIFGTERFGTWICFCPQVEGWEAPTVEYIHQKVSSQNAIYSMNPCLENNIKITNPVQSPSHETNSCSASQDIPHILWEPQVPYRAQKSH
jgi:hypothetical protein